MSKDQFLMDLQLAQREYPFLQLEPPEYKEYPFKLEDDFEVIDDEGNHYGTFRASVHFPACYPKGFPLMFDMSRKFPWKTGWHMSIKKGECCVCGVIEKEEVGQQGITVKEYIQKYVLPFYANQIYRSKYGFYKNGEYSHNQEGVWESLEEEFNTKDRLKIQGFLQEIKNKRGRNDFCFCGSGKKYKYCHLPRVKIIEPAIKSLW